MVSVRHEWVAPHYSSHCSVAHPLPQPEVKAIALGENCTSPHLFSMQCGECINKAEARAAGPYEARGVTGPPEESDESKRGSSSGGGSFPSASPSSSDPSLLHQPLMQWVWNYFSGRHAPSRHMTRPLSSAPPEASAGQQPSSSLQIPQSGIAPVAAAAGEEPGACIARAAAGDSGGGGATTVPSVRADSGSGGGVSGGSGGSGSGGGGGSGSGPVTCTRLSPLYFQHDGHSRTIIGIERRPDPAAAAARDVAQAARFFSTAGSGGWQGGDGGQGGSGHPASATASMRKRPLPTREIGGSAADGFVYTLLVLDPGLPTSSLWEAVRYSEGRAGLATRPPPL